jgi:hypothetical protein
LALDNGSGDVEDENDDVDDFKWLLDLVTAAAMVALRAAAMRASMTRFSDDDDDDDDDGGSPLPPMLTASTSSIRQVDAASAH